MKKEEELFPAVQKFFKEQGYKVYCEVPLYYSRVDVVSSKKDYTAACEMKLVFNADVVHQAIKNKSHFHLTYIAIPTKPKKWDENQKVAWCRSYGIGILYVAKDGEIDVLLAAKEHIPQQIFDTSALRQGNTAGLKTMSGVSSANLVLKRIKNYVKKHPNSNWGEIFDNVQNHYAHKVSLRSSMQNWKGFDLEHYRKTLPNYKPIVQPKEPKVTSLFA